MTPNRPSKNSVPPRAEPRARHLSIRLKLMVYFLVIILLPLVSLGVIWPTLYAGSIERENTAHTARLISQVSTSIEFRVREMERLIDLVARDPAVGAFFERGRPQPGERESIARALKAVSGTHTEIAGILLVNEANEQASDGLYRITRDPLTEEPWYLAARNSPGEVRLMARPFGRNVRNARGYGADEVVAIAKSITWEDGLVEGAVLLDMRLSTVEDHFTDTSLGKNGFLFIADADGEVVYAPTNPVVYRVPPSMLGDGGSATLRVRGGDYQVLSQRSPYTGWKTVGVFSLAEALETVRLVRYWSVVVGGVTLLLAAVAAVFFTSSIARPVLRLRSLMKRAEEGDLGVRFGGGSGDEIGELGLGFDDMIERIQYLIDQVYREQQSKREAELRILQEQIKPHFLYNTLDTIQWMAQENRVEDVVRMVGALTRLFRIGLSKGREVISLAEEIEHVESYLCIQKMRYEDKFDFEVRVEEGLAERRVLRLMLQPLVENAIYHGIKERRGRGRLVVEARSDAGELRLEVRDDGAGMDEAFLGRLNAFLAAFPDGEGEAGAPEAGGYGIRNVHERIRLTFGRPYGLSFAAADGGGTVAAVRHPLLDPED